MSISANSLYKRDPFDVVDGIPIFVNPAILATVDEYAGGNPYRDETSSNSVWDRFRQEIISSRACGPYVLDLGCGEGGMTSSLCDRFEHIAASDLSFTAVKSNRERHSKAHFCVADACDLPYIDDHFDSVVCANLFEHVESRNVR
jgi:2-polyprenyl-3-methyl-5-hydroxy-6-metoxy-1,4-benzoquinol methylase